MKKFKGLFAFALVLIFAFGLVGCAGEKEAEDANMDIAPQEEPAPVDTTTPEPVEVDVVEEGVLAYFANMPEHIYKIGEKDFMEKVKAGDDMVVLDIRTAEDYAKGHVVNAISLPWGTDIGDNITKIPQDKEVFIYCYTGQTAGQAVMTMNLAGINARSVNLGWNLGIAKVEGYEEYTDTEVYPLGTEEYEVNPDIVAAIEGYYEGLADVEGTPYKFYKISEDDLNGLIENAEDFYLLSVRSAEDYAKGHIEGAENIPWGAGMQEGFDSLPLDKKVVVYCYTGQTSGQTVAGLRLLGFDAVSLNGGTGTPGNAPHGWTNHGYELVQ